MTTTEKINNKVANIFYLFLFFISLHGNTDLNQWTFRLDDLDHNHHRDANHGGKGKSPA